MHPRRHASLTVLLTLTTAASPASAHYLTVFGGPTYAPGSGGFQGGFASDVNDAGVAIGVAYKVDSSDSDLGARPFRWDGSGSPAIELGNLGASGDGVANVYAYAINNSGTAVGSAEKDHDIGEYPVTVPIRWAASSTAATELGHFGTDGNNHAMNYASDVNEVGTAVGVVRKYNDSGGDLGDRAVRWDASGTTATELEHLGTEPSGNTYASAAAINDAGTIVGDAWKYDAAGVPLGTRAVRWNASSTAATELASLGADGNGYAANGAYAINDSGTAVGYAVTFDGEGVQRGSLAVRWEASGTAATELGNLGTDSDGFTDNFPLAISNDGTAVGYAEKYDGAGNLLGYRAVRWNGSGTAATELGNLGTDVDGVTDSVAYKINNAGIAVGYAAEYDGSGTLLGDRATYWGLDGIAVDLNDLVDPASGWTLEYAEAISDTRWIAGTGTFDPDGPGPQEAYMRLFLLKLPRAGDFDFDDDIDGHDFLVWQRGDSPDSLSSSDLTDWQAHFGQHLSPLVATADAVPEPAGWTLLALAVPGWFAAACCNLFKATRAG
jgi:hypothetical protein